MEFEVIGVEEVMEDKAMERRDKNKKNKVMTLMKVM